MGIKLKLTPRMQKLNGRTYTEQIEVSDISQEPEMPLAFVHIDTFYPEQNIHKPLADGRTVVVDVEMYTVLD